jgi:hypothetical protein
VKNKQDRDRRFENQMSKTALMRNAMPMSLTCLLVNAIIIAMLQENQKAL